MPLNPLVTRFQDILGDIADIAHRIGRAVLPYAGLNQTSVGEFRRQLETIRVCSNAMFGAITLNNSPVDDRIIDWLTSGEPRVCLQKLKEMDNMMLKCDAQARSVPVAVRTAEDRLAEVMTFFDRRKGLFRFFLTSDIWDRQKLVHQPWDAAQIAGLPATQKTQHGPQGNLMRSGPIAPGCPGSEGKHTSNVELTTRCREKLYPQLVAARSELRADVPTFVPRAGYISQVEKADDEENIQLEGPDVEPMGEFIEEPALIRGYKPTEEEISAAKKIQATYRTYRKHRDARVCAIGRGLKAQGDLIFIACLKNVYTCKWARTPYRTLYLWALPRLIVCLDKAVVIAQGVKGKIKHLLLKTSHERLEELAKRTTTMNDLLKKARNLRKEIEPNATMHQARDKAKIRKAVLDVKDIIDRLPSAVPDIQKEFQFAYELVMREKKRAIQT